MVPDLFSAFFEGPLPSGALCVYYLISLLDPLLRHHLLLIFYYFFVLCAIVLRFAGWILIP